MSANSYTTRADARIAHVQSHLTGGGFRLDELADNIRYQRGNPKACLMTLESHAQASAMNAWFAQHDLARMRQWFYVASMLDKRWYQMEVDTLSPGAKMLQLMSPLLSNHRGLIDWFAHYGAAYDAERVHDPKTHDFWAYQAVLALRGDWQVLAERCETVIGLETLPRQEMKYLPDHHFYLALARKDIDGMRVALQDILQPKSIRARLNDESGYTADLISTPAVIYAKIAWLHGFQVEVESPYVPREWLPSQPLSHYDPHYDFLAG